MNTLEQKALEVIGTHFLKILKINLTNDSFTIIRSDTKELNEEPGFNNCHNKISVWLHEFAKNGGVQFADLEGYLKQTDRQMLSEYFRNGNTGCSLSYRHQVGKDFHWVAMKFCRAEDYADIDQNLYLYVIDIDDNIQDYINQTVKLRSELREKEEENKLLSSLASIYLTLHVIDLDNNTLEEYSSYFRVREYANHTDDAASQAKATIKNLIVPEYIDDALEFVDLSTVRERLGERHIISKELVGKHIGWFRAAFIPVDLNKDGQLRRVIFATHVIDEEKRREEYLIKISSTDALTRLYNRYAYENDLSQLRESALQPSLSVLSFDVNGLKTVNDTLGHVAGDELIRAAAYYIKDSFSQLGKCYRIGGDEFVAFVNIIPEHLQALLKEFAIKTGAWKGTLIDKLTISVGVASACDHPDITIDELNKLADKDMYRVKGEYYRQFGDRRKKER